MRMITINVRSGRTMFYDDVVDVNYVRNSRKGRKDDRRDQRRSKDFNRWCNRIINEVMKYYWQTHYDKEARH